MRKYLFFLILLAGILKLNIVLADTQGMYQNDRIASKLAEAKANLKGITAALETYSASNGGNYPALVSDFSDAKPPYMKKNFCDTTVDGYKYTCDFTISGYTVTATPADGSQAVSATTGGSIQDVQTKGAE